MAVRVTAVICGLNTPAMILKEPQEAMESAEYFLEALSNGSLTEAAAYLLGHLAPDKISSFIR